MKKILAILFWGIVMTKPVDTIGATDKINNHLKNSFTPIIPNNSQAGIWINLPQTKLPWGEPLPLFGLLRLKKEDTIKPKVLRYFITSAIPINFNTSNITTRTNEEAFSDFVKLNQNIYESYFNANALDKLGMVLPPGQYTLYVDLNDGSEISEKISFEIMANSWRADWAKKVIEHTCQKNLILDMSLYLARYNLAGIETPVDNHSLDIQQNELLEFWQRGIQKHHELFLDHPISEMEVIGMLDFLKKETPKNCNKELNEPRYTDFYKDFLRGLILYSSK